MAERRLLKRSDAEERFTWNLKDIFESDEAWSEEYKALKELPDALTAYKGKLGESAEELLSYFKLSEEAALRLGKLMTYANCSSDEDTADGAYQDMKGKAVSCYVECVSASAFATPEILDIPQDKLDGFFASERALETYRRSVERIRRRKEHILSTAEETLLAAAGEMANGPDNIGGIFRNADLRYPAAYDRKGNEHTLTGETLVPLLESGDRELRRSAFSNFFSVLDSYKNTFAATLDAQFKQLLFFSRARKYASLLEASLDENEVPTEVYTNLIEAVHSNLDKMYRYVALRKRALGLRELHMYDVYTPIVADAAENIGYEQAKETVLEALSVLGEDYTALLREGFENRWIDVYENQGKRGGAYSSGSAHPHPYVLLNQKDNLESMFTIAHEMGHALHSYYSCANQSVANEDYVIFVAEVASTCNEVLLMRHLLEHCGDKKQRAYLINRFLDMFKGTLYRQTMFAEFELELGRMAERGDTLTADVLCEKYKALNALYFGPEMISDDEIALEWARIPHFFYNYYVFQYATGFSAAVAIANRILAQGESAVADYKRFLSGGSSADPVSLLKMAGVDMSSPEPVNSALELFSELTAELEGLI